MTFKCVTAVTLRYFTEFGKPVFQHNRVDLWRNLCASLLYFVVRVICRRKESSRSLSHLLMSFLFILVTLLRFQRSLYFFQRFHSYADSWIRPGEDWGWKGPSYQICSRLPRHDRTACRENPNRERCEGVSFRLVPARLLMGQRL